MTTHEISEREYDALVAHHPEWQRRHFGTMVLHLSDPHRREACCFRDVRGVRRYFRYVRAKQRPEVRQKGSIC